MCEGDDVAEEGEQGVPVECGGVGEVVGGDGEGEEGVVHLEKEEAGEGVGLGGRGCWVGVAGERGLGEFGVEGGGGVGLGPLGQAGEELGLREGDGWGCARGGEVGEGEDLGGFVHEDDKVAPGGGDGGEGGGKGDCGGCIGGGEGCVDKLEFGASGAPVDGLDVHAGEGLEQVLLDGVGFVGEVEIGRVDVRSAGGLDEADDVAGVLEVKERGILAARHDL